MTQLQLYNSLTRKKEPFTPHDAEHVTMYVCGPTVYARPHIGNARSVVVYDVLYRLLNHLYPKVTYVRNITDVDDKINTAAIERGMSIQDLTEEVTGWFHEDMAALGCLPPTIEPKATEHIAQIISMVERLIAHGNAYVAEGHVLFDVTSTPSPQPSPPVGEREASAKARASEGEFKWHYGMLSGRTVEEQQAGARVAVESYKKHPGDFVLWKPADDEDDDSSKFDSPWGEGRPGWHIECSAMSTEYLGQNFDIHGGGADLKFPHHENEIAQSCCANPGSHFARYWVHNGFLTVNGEKMAKSAGNFITVRDLLDRGIKGEVIRLALLMSKYNEPLDWSDEKVKEAEKLLDKWYRLFAASSSSHLTRGSLEEILGSSPRMTLFVNALSDDMNTSQALTMIQQLDEQERIAAAQFLGLLQQDPDEWFKGAASEDDSEIQTQIDARTQAKKAKDFATADRIRDELKAEGIILEDRPDGTTDWRRA